MGGLISFWSGLARQPPKFWMASLSYFCKCGLTERVDDVGACFDAYLDRIQERTSTGPKAAKKTHVTTPWRSYHCSFHFSLARKRSGVPGVLPPSACYFCISWLNSNSNPKQPQQPGRMADPVAKEVVVKVEVGRTNNMNMKKCWKRQSESPQSFWWNDTVLVGPTVLFGRFLSCLSLTDCGVRVFFLQSTLLTFNSWMPAYRIFLRKWNEPPVLLPQKLPRWFSV